METMRTTISGIIIPSKWDQDGNITRTAVVTFDEDTFDVVDDGPGRSLMNHLRQTVTIDGQVSLSGAIKQLSVEQFKVHPVD